MTKVLTDRVEETYKQVFGNTIAEPDRERISFLRDVVTGEVDYEGKRFPLDEADGFVEHEKNELITDAQEVKDKKQKEDMLNEIAGLDDILKIYDAVRTMREKWYLRAESKNRQDAKIEVVSELLEAGLGYVNETLNDCMEVLHKQRIKDLYKQLDNAFEVKGKIKDTAISLVSESLLQKKSPELTELVVTRMAEYHKHLRGLLDDALENSHERAVARVVKRIEYSGVPSLIKYASIRIIQYSQPTHDKP